MQNLAQLRRQTLVTRASVLAFFGATLLVMAAPVLSAANEDETAAGSAVPRFEPYRGKIAAHDEEPGGDRT